MRRHQGSRGMEAQIVDDEEDPEMDAYVVYASCAQRVRAVAEARGTRPLVLQTSFSAPSSLGCLGGSCKGSVGLADLRSAGLGRTRVVWPNARATGQHDRGKRRSSPA
jgi:hypothetical protein